MSFFSQDLLGFNSFNHNGNCFNNCNNGFHHCGNCNNGCFGFVNKHLLFNDFEKIECDIKRLQHDVFEAERHLFADNGHHHCGHCRHNCCHHNNCW